MIDYTLEKALIDMWEKGELGGIPKSWTLNDFLGYLHSYGRTIIKAERRSQEDEEKEAKEFYREVKPSFDRMAEAFNNLAEAIASSRREAKPTKKREFYSVFNEEEEKLFSTAKDAKPKNKPEKYPYKEEEDEKKSSHLVDSSGSNRAVYQEPEKYPYRPEDKEETKKGSKFEEMAEEARRRRSEEPNYFARKKPEKYPYKEKEKKPQVSRSYNRKPKSSSIDVARQTLMSLTPDERKELLGSLTKRDRDLTRSAHTRRAPERIPADSVGGIGVLAPIHTAAVQRDRIWKPLTNAAKQERERAKMEVEVALARTNAEAIGKQFTDTPWWKLPPETIEEAKAVFGKKFSKIVEENEKKFQGR